MDGKGGKNRRRGKNENESEKRELVFKEDGQEYAQVIKMLGNGRLEAMCFDGVKRLCHIRGKLRKKDNKADVILKYNADEARSLKAYGELPEHAKINETDTFGPGDDDEIQFDDIGDDDEDIDDSRVSNSWAQSNPPASATQCWDYRCEPPHPASHRFQSALFTPEEKKNQIGCGVGGVVERPRSAYGMCPYLSSKIDPNSLLLSLPG
ncbi:Eukaryotic translation initiation factor 1A, X-chromosomal [Plecturocebus cupreus]